MIETVIRNLVSNAIKFTENGGSIEVNYTRNETGHHLVSVHDNGIDITEEIRKNLFREGTDVKRKGTMKELSSGIGLLLCKEFIDFLKGRIWVESEPGLGSTFFISIPY